MKQCCNVVYQLNSCLGTSLVMYSKGKVCSQNYCFSHCTSFHMNIEETCYKFVVAKAFGMFTCDHNLVTLGRRHPLCSVS